MSEPSATRALDAGFATVGAAITPAVNRPFSIQGVGTVWLVESGTLDLYLVDVANKGPEGARHFITRIADGGAVLAFPAADCNLALVAVAGPGTAVRELSREDLRRAASGSTAMLVCNLLEKWVEQLSFAAATQTPPRVYGALEAGTEFTIGFDAQCLMPHEGVVWVRQVSGTSSFLGEPELPLKAGEWLPISRHSWLLSAPSGKLAVYSWSSLQLQDPGWSGLDLFQTLILHCLLRNRKLSADMERRRLTAKAEADAAQLDAAISRLATPLQPESRARIADQHALDDPLLLAARAVGQAQGIAISASQGMRRGLKLKDPVAAIAKASSVRTRRVLLRDRWWTNDCGPVLAFRDRDNHPLALLPRNANSYDLYDPADRSTTRVNAAVAATLNGFAYVFYRPFPYARLTVTDLLRFGLRGCRRDLLTILWMGLATGLVGLAAPFATAILFDTAIPGSERGQVMQIGAILVACATAAALFTVTRSFALLRLEARMDASIQSAIWDRLLNLPIPFFRDYTAGDLALRGIGINQMRQTLTGLALNSIMAGVFSIFSFGLLFYYSVPLALLATGLAAVAFVISLVCGYVQVRHQREMAEVRGRISGSVLQFISGIAKLRVAAAENRVFSSWARDFATQKEISRRARQVQNQLNVVNATYPLLCLICIFAGAAKLMAQPGAVPFTTGEFVAFNAAFAQFLIAALQLSSAIVSVLGILPLYERARPIFQTLPEVSATQCDPGELTGAIEINHVVFRYRPGTPLVLKDVSISIRPGEFIAFVGPSGSGKSTLFRMLLGFENPESGSIYYDGQDLSSLDIHAVRRQVGVVLQNGKLFSGDIFSNIVGSAPLTVDDAWEAARMAGLDQDLRHMPMGMHTVISEGGGGLSGGQRQRVLIARAIVNRPRILLFDEATSALDNQSQSIVSDSLGKLQATRVVIAHRLSTIVNADRVYVLDKGNIVQSGSCQELMAQDGLFAELARRQLA